MLIFINNKLKGTKIIEKIEKKHIQFCQFRVLFCQFRSLNFKNRAIADYKALSPTHCRQRFMPFSVCENSTPTLTVFLWSVE